MKRLFIVFGILLILAGVGTYWFVTQETADKVLVDSISGLAKWKTAKDIKLDVSVTNQATKTTSGFSFVGPGDLSDLAHVRAQGNLRIGARTSTEQDQTGDIILDKASLALRPQSVNANWRALYQRLAKDPTAQLFLVMNRDAFLKYFGCGEAVGKGSDADMRETLSSLSPTIHVDGIRTTSQAGKRLVTTDFHFDEVMLRPWLISVVHAWTKDTPTISEYGWIDRMTKDLSHGKFHLTLDRWSRAPVSLTGEWPLYSEAGVLISTVNVQLQLDGYNQVVNIGLAGKSLDVTEQTVLPRAIINSFPTSKGKVVK